MDANATRSLERWNAEPTPTALSTRIELTIAQLPCARVVARLGSVAFEPFSRQVDKRTHPLHRKIFLGPMEHHDS